MIIKYDETEKSCLLDDDDDDDGELTIACVTADVMAYAVVAFVSFNIINVVVVCALFASSTPCTMAITDGTSAYIVSP